MLNTIEQRYIWLRGIIQNKHVIIVIHTQLFLSYFKILAHLLIVNSKCL